MRIIDKLIARFLKNRLPKHEDWKVTDHIIEIKDVMQNIKISSEDKVDDKEGKSPQSKLLAVINDDSRHENAPNACGKPRNDCLV